MREEETSDRLGKRLRILTADIKLYVEKRAELLMLNAGEQLANWFAQTIDRLTGIFLLLAGVVFMLVSLAIYLGNLLGSASLGYLLVSLPLAVAGAVLLYLRPRFVVDRIQKEFESELLRALYREGGDTENRIPDLPSPGARRTDNE